MAAAVPRCLNMTECKLMTLLVWVICDSLSKRLKIE